MIACNSMFDKKIDRLKSTLDGRLRLLNMFKKLIEKSYKPLTMDNIKLDLESEEEITDFIVKNNEYIDGALIRCMDDWFKKNGSEWQKKRIEQYFKK